MDENLPHSVAAILDDREVHRQFLETYNVNSDDYPLVSFVGDRFVEVIV